MNIDRIAKNLSNGSTEGLKLRSLDKVGTRLRGIVDLPPDGRQFKFEILGFRGRIFLLIASGRKRAQQLARFLSRLIEGELLEVKVPSRRLRELYQEGVVKLVVFDMVRIPGLRRVVLTGDAVSDTNMYKEFADVCETRYVLFETREGVLLGVSDSCSVVALSSLTDDELFELVKDRILPLLATPL
ncbi:MAG: hypothetical protein NZ954_03155 [Thermofilaceae archaeon]|nr:hypothetical protein [Thermofilaceae archaeon]MCX8181053.1 hypothetical protein [Thermofilaceae archaeon]MDW8004534.1 hypothetical protein [Thermofilaceae archaeon]